MFCRGRCHRELHTRGLFHPLSLPGNTVSVSVVLISVLSLEVATENFTQEGYFNPSPCLVTLCQCPWFLSVFCRWRCHRELHTRELFHPLSLPGSTVSVSVVLISVLSLEVATENRTQEGYFIPSPCLVALCQYPWFLSVFCRWRLPQRTAHKRVISSPLPAW